MEEEINKYWMFVKSIVYSDLKTKNRPYLTQEQQEIFEQKIRRALREKKLQRILK